MIVYRVEDEKAHGPYGWDNDTNSQLLPKYLFEAGGPLECECDARPGPPMDFSPEDVRKIVITTRLCHIRERYGFKTLDQFQSWFDSQAIQAICKFAPNIYGLAVYEVPTLLAEAHKQVAWLDKDTKRLSWTPLEFIQRSMSC